MRSTRFNAIVPAGVTTAVFYTAQPAAQTRSQVRFVTNDPACQSTTMVSTGGAAPRDPNTLAVRWAGTTNFELSYKGQVVLLDAYFDRGAVFPSIGFRAADVKRADVLLIGHGHFDHMSDAASVAHRTGASVVGASVTPDKLADQAIPTSQMRTWM